GASAITLARRWSATGAHVIVYQLPDSLRLPHDMIDPMEPGGRPATVYPVIEALIRGESPLGWVTQR
ncbi:MAG: hypothetical protein ACR2GG_05915, partial [Gemmatimonadaceae bacterium]